MKLALQGNDDVVGMAPASFTAYQEYNNITANQAILEAKGAGRVHMVDLDAAHGVHRPPLQHAIYDRADTNLGSPEVRIIGASPDLDDSMCSSAPASAGL
jgi:hypothetical protein